MQVQIPPPSSNTQSILFEKRQWKRCELRFGFCLLFTGFIFLKS
jgi:hypothetical protein